MSHNSDINTTSSIKSNNNTSNIKYVVNSNKNLDDILNNNSMRDMNSSVFPPTNFYIQWGDSNHSNYNNNSIGGDSHNNTSNNNNDAKWLTPRDLIPKPWKPTNSKEFQLNKPTSHNILVKTNKNNHDYNTNINNIIPPLDSLQPIQSAAIHSVLNTVKPFVTKEFINSSNINNYNNSSNINNSLGPGQYNPKYEPVNTISHGFTSGQKSLNWNLYSGGGTNSNINNNNSGINNNNNGNINYISTTASVSMNELLFQPNPVTSEANKGNFMSKTPRFKEKLLLQGQTPAAGAYNINYSSIESNANKSHTFTGRKSFQSVSYIRRDRGPDMGTYDINKSEAKLPHKFTQTPRFLNGIIPGADNSGIFYNDSLLSQRFKLISPSDTLILSDSKRRNAEIIHLIKPDIESYTAKRKSQQIQQQKELREFKLQSIDAKKAKEQLIHAEKIDKIINKEKYREQRRVELAEKQFKQKLQFGWIFYITLASRSQLIYAEIRKNRTRNGLRLLAQQAAKTIQKFCLNWLNRFRHRRFMKNGNIILRTLRRNVIRNKMKRNRNAVKILSITLLNYYNKLNTLKCIRSYVNYAICIQRAWRRYTICRDYAILLLEKQWEREENDLCERYKTQTGEITFEKLRKKGLLLRNVSHNEQRKKIILETKFYKVPDELRRDLLWENYNNRKNNYKQLIIQYNKNMEFSVKLGEFRNDLHKQIQVKQDKNKRINEGIDKISILQQIINKNSNNNNIINNNNNNNNNNNTENSGELIELLDESNLPNNTFIRPQFHVLLPTTNMFQLISIAHNKMGIDKSIKYEYKKIINQTLKIYLNKGKIKYQKQLKYLRQLAQNIQNNNNNHLQNNNANTDKNNNSNTITMINKTSGTQSLLNSNINTINNHNNNDDKNNNNLNNINHTKSSASFIGYTNDGGW